jgi:hypothetical protein
MYYQNREESDKVLQILHLLKNSVSAAHKKFLTLKEVEVFLGLSRTKIYYLRKMGALKVMTVGHKKYISMDEIEKYYRGGIVE